MLAGDDHARPEIDQDQRGQMLQRLAEAAGEVARRGPDCSPVQALRTQVALEAPLHVGLERQEP